MTALQEWFRGIDLSRVIDWLLFALAALGAISVHESSHALCAHWLGDDTAKRMGRISLNPLHHLDPTGFVLMILVHFGWARPVPVDMRRFKNPKLGMAATALAGPLSNVLLALISAFVYCLLFYLSAPATQRMLNGAAAPSGLAYYIVRFFLICMSLNAGLAVFNLIPISPLDGSKILGILLPAKAYYTLMRYERYGMMLLVLLLLVGALDGPLQLLQQGLVDGLLAVSEPVAYAIAGA